MAAARLQMEHEVADAVAQQSAQAQAQVHTAAQPESGESQRATAESPQASNEARAAENQGQLLSSIRDFVKMARDGIKQRQVTLQYARSTWQVYTHIHMYILLYLSQASTARGQPHVSRGQANSDVCHD